MTVVTVTCEWFCMNFYIDYKSGCNLLYIGQATLEIEFDRFTVTSIDLFMSDYTRSVKSIRCIISERDQRLCRPTNKLNMSLNDVNNQTKQTCIMHNLQY